MEKNRGPVFPHTYAERDPEGIGEPQPAPAPVRRSLRSCLPPASARQRVAAWILLACALPLFAVSCRSTQTRQSPVRRVALLPWEDQSLGASAGWLARIAPFALRRQLESIPLLQAAETRFAADFPAATHELSGFVAAGQDRLEAHLFLYELPSHKLALHRVFVRSAGQWRHLLEDAAGFLTSSLQRSGKLNPVGVHTEAAARHLAQALSASIPGAAVSAFRSAAEADPACGWCWLGWAESAAVLEGREAALAVIREGSKHRDQMDPLTLARLDLLAANLLGNRFEAASATARVAAASPADPLIQLQHSEALVANRDYKGAEAALRNALALADSMAPLWNSLAYALAYQNRFEEALAAIRRYEELDPGPNPADSRGEILMMAGRFREAAQSFGQSYQKDPAFNGGAAMEKAALCWMLEGDSGRAAEAASRLVQDRAQRGDRMAALAQARWELLLGRTGASTARFARAARDASDLVAPQAASMLALRLAFLDPAAAARWLPSGPQRDPVNDLFRAYAAAALDPSSIEKARDHRLQLELRALSLTCRREWNRAAEGWQAVIQASPGGTDFAYRELRALCLVHAGDTAQAEKTIGKAWPVLAPGQMLFYDFLVYPALLYTRAEIARAAGRTEEARRLYDLFLQFADGRPDLAAAISRARSAVRL